MPTVSVKWQKELFPAVEIDTCQPPLVFKCQLYDLTGVPPERQKIMVKGGLLKDDADWSTLGVKEGQRLMMMGTADEIVKAPEKGTVFMEDLPEEEQVVAMGHSAGLFNLGNTCYMNSTLQCLHSVPELKSALLKYPQSGRSNELDQSSHLLTCATRDLFNELDRNVKPVAPMQFWTVLRKKYPQFGQLHNGVFMQQDAEECWTQLIYTLSQTLRVPDTSCSQMRGRSYSYSPSPPRYYGRRGRSPSPRGRYGARSRDFPTSLLVRNLRLDCRAEDIRRIFGQFGPLKDVYLPRDYHTGCSQMRGRSYSYSPSPPRYHGRRGRSPSPRGRYGARSRDFPTSLLVRNLRLDCRAEDIRRIFGQFGPLKDVYLPRDYHTGEPRGFGFIQYVDPEDAGEAKYQMDGQILHGRELTVVFAEENRKKPTEMRARERFRGRVYDHRRSPPRYSRSPRHSRSSRYARSRSRSVSHYSPSPRRRHYSRSVSPLHRRYYRER